MHLVCFMLKLHKMLYDTFINKIFNMDCNNFLLTLPSNSIDCIVTSPPYYGLRDYGVSGQIGLEESPSAYVSRLVEVFAELYRVLKPNGTCWLNLGDSYVTTSPNGGGGKNMNIHGEKYLGRRKAAGRLQPKQLMGMPWRVALALQDNGWYLRQDIIWNKTNAMPESVKDRCTRSHEYIFLLTKTDKYYFNPAAIAEPVISTKGNARSFRGGGGYIKRQCFNNSETAKRGTRGNVFNSQGTRNKRSVWNIATQASKYKHFATFPDKLAETCILAGCPEDGLVLDPFMGTGTTALVSLKNNRQFTGCDLNESYINIAKNRIENI